MPGYLCGKRGADIYLPHKGEGGAIRKLRTRRPGLLVGILSARNTRAAKRGSRLGIDGDITEGADGPAHLGALYFVNSNNRFSVSTPCVFVRIHGATGILEKSR